MSAEAYFYERCFTRVSSWIFNVLPNAYHIGSICFQGDGAFWFNLKRSGAGDFSTRHAACPVLAGTKWGTLDLKHCHIIVLYYF